MNHNQIITQIQNVLQEKGSKYRCKNVSWDDVSRFGAGGGSAGLSCMGSNITDTRLFAKDGTLLYTVRPENWNEKLGIVSSDDISLIYDNKPITLTDYLYNFSDYAKYALKNKSESLLAPERDQKVSIRFQTTFLPVRDIEQGYIEVAPEAYNYGSKNINLLCTSQGTSVQQNLSGRNKLFHHEVDSNGKIHRYWFEVERSKHSVGGQQTETEDEKKEALARGKSIATCIGVKSMGTRFNVLMTVQIPTKKEEERRGFLTSVKKTGMKKSDGMRGGSGKRGGFGGSFGGGFEAFSSNSGNMSALNVEEEEECEVGGGFDDESDEEVYRTMSNSAPPRVSAGRLSRGSEYDTWSGISNKIERNKEQHITVTIVLYNTVAGGVPTEDDVMNAIEDMEKLYESCLWNGKLGDTQAKFMDVKPFTPKVQSYNEAMNKFPTSNYNYRESATDCKV